MESNQKKLESIMAQQEKGGEQSDGEKPEDE